MDISVADELEFDALPERTRELARKIITEEVRENEVAPLEEDYENQQKEIDKLERSKRELEDEVETLKDETETLKDQIADLTADNEELQKEVNRLTKKTEQDNLNSTDDNQNNNKEDTNMLSATVTANDVKPRRGRPRKLISGENSGPNIDLAYRAAMAAFVTILIRDQGQTILQGENAKKTLNIDSIQGRKFDRIVRTVVSESGRGRKSTKVLFFVNNETGDIYGPRSDQAPNFKRWYGTLETAVNWSWIGDEPVPTDKANVKPVKKYGDVTFYEPA